MTDFVCHQAIDNKRIWFCWLITGILGPSETLLRSGECGPAGFVTGIFYWALLINLTP